MKHKFIAKKYWVNHATTMGQSDMLAKTYGDCIDLSLGDPDMVTHRLIIDRSYQDALAGHTRYTDFRGDPELRAEICKFYSEEYSMRIKDEEIFVTTSACLGMFLTLEAVIDDGNEVILPAPFFSPYAQQVEMAGGIPVELPTFEEEDYQINAARLKRLITKKTKAIIINSPSNPTGSCLTLDTMKELASIAQKYDLVVISDDIYTAFCYERPFVPIASLPGMQERTIIINSFSKNFTMTGWRIGNIIAPEYIVYTIQKINENVAFTAPSISQRAAIYALRYRNIIQPPIIEEYKSRVFYAAKRINRMPNMSVPYPPKGGFYLFINIKDTGLTSAEITDRILKEAHVLVLPGKDFGRCGEGYVRIACTVDKSVLKEAFDRIERMSLCC